MNTIAESHRQSNGAYFGDFPAWLVAYAIHRDSDCLERSNYEELKERFLAVSPENEQWTIETSSHWLVGHIEHLIVAPDSECERIALDAIEALENYPVLNEERYSEMEYNEALDMIEDAFGHWYYRQRSSVYPNTSELGAITSYIYTYYADISNDYLRESWPTDDVIFWGYVAYRLATKHATQ